MFLSGRPERPFSFSDCCVPVFRASSRAWHPRLKFLAKRVSPAFPVAFRRLVIPCGSLGVGMYRNRSHRLRLSPAVNRDLARVGTCPFSASQKKPPQEGERRKKQQEVLGLETFSSPARSMMPGRRVQAVTRRKASPGSREYGWVEGSFGEPPCDAPLLIDEIDQQIGGG